MNNSIKFLMDKKQLKFAKELVVKYHYSVAETAKRYGNRDKKSEIVFFHTANI